ncbi:MAG: cell division protein ZapA [Chitinispirillales bacterium]|nr:cell division protein ZapA [Chitinispirillales bacterium]
MSSESVRVKLKIFDTEFSIRDNKGGAGAETLEQVAYYVKSKIAELQEQTKIRDEGKIAVMSALNIAMELFETKAKYEAEARKVQECQERIKSINNMIGSVKKVN